MKLIIALALVLSAQVYAADICSFPETSDFIGALKEEGIKPARTSKNHSKWTFTEKAMIHLTISLENHLKGVSREDALKQFADWYDGKPGSNAGEIVYFDIAGKKFALVHYWPGDNEYGAYFQVKMDGSFKMIAEIQDSFITCK